MQNRIIPNNIATILIWAAVLALVGMAWAQLRIARALEDANRARPQETSAVEIHVHPARPVHMLLEYAANRMIAVAVMRSHIAGQPPCGRPAFCLTAPGSAAQTLQPFPNEVRPRSGRREAPWNGEQ